MSLIIAWIGFPLLLAAIGAGWGGLVERASGERISGALIVPLGLAAAIVVACLLTTWPATAPAAAPVVAAGAAAGLVLTRPFRRVRTWPLVVAAAVLLVYGAPVILSGQATFTGYTRLDDTATWFSIIDRIMSHGRSLHGLGPSTYELILFRNLVGAYPLGSFVLPGIGHVLSTVDVAWIFQPYLACCGACVGLSVYALCEPLVKSQRLRALVAFIAAQPALLYGYSLWGGIKELTASFLVVLGIACLAPVLLRPPARWRALVPVSVATAALLLTLGVGAAAWLAPAFVIVIALWSRSLWIDAGRRGVAAGRERLRGIGKPAGALVGLTAILVIPLWVVLGSFFGDREGLFSNLFSSGESAEVRLGNLLHPLSAWQLGGVWPVGDFRTTAPALRAAVFLVPVVIAASAGIWAMVRRSRPALAVYVIVVLVACAGIYLAGSTPWVVGKTLAISSPAVLAAAMAACAIASERHRIALVAVAVVAGGVLWSNVLAYHDALLAPRARLAELDTVASAVRGNGPTFINQYEIYADRHFLRTGSPIEPAEYRAAYLPLSTGAVLTKSAWADLDSFSTSTLYPYRSIVLPTSPVTSRPPSIYRLVWAGRYYDVWQRPKVPSTVIVDHVPLGDQDVTPYCGQAQNGAYLPACSLDPVAVPACSFITRLSRLASREHGWLVAYQRPQPIVARADRTLWPASWYYSQGAHALWPADPGTAAIHFELHQPQEYALWLGGSFARGFEVSVDGREVGDVKDQLGNIGDYAEVGVVRLGAGVHTVSLTYPNSNLTPGSGDDVNTMLTSVVLEPMQVPLSELLTASPADARSLCGRSLDWVEVVAPRRT